MEQSFEPEFGGAIHFDFVIGEITDTEEVEDFSLFSVYPNPANEAITVDLKGIGDQAFDIELVSLTGQVVYQQSFENVINDALQHRIPLTGLAQGMYFVKVQNGSKVRVREVVVMD